MLNETNLYPFQHKIINTLMEHEKYCVWVDMGLGKTICTLTVVARLLKAGRITGALVVAPKTVAENVWKQEAMAWEHTSGLTVSVISGNASNRLAGARCDADIYVVSRDNFAWLSEQKLDGCKLDRVDMLVIDESTSFKHRNTMRWKALCQKGKRKRKWLDNFARIVLLSGTPASESYEGLWAQVYIIDQGERLFPSITRFRQTYMIPETIRGNVIYRKFKDGAERVIDGKIKDICIAMEAKDYIDLPDKLDIIRYTGYEKDDLYDTMNKHGVIEIDNVHIMAVEPATRYGKLRQICSGWVYDELGEEHYVHSKKEDTLKDVLEELQSENVLIFYQYDYERMFLMLEHGAELLDTPDQQAKWNAGEIKTACAHPASLGYGNNIQFGGHVIIWYTLPLSYEQYIQSCGRLHRQGQDKTVKVIHLIAQNTIEEKIYKLLKEKKADLLQHLMLAMKEN